METSLLPQLIAVALSAVTRHTRLSQEVNLLSKSCDRMKREDRLRANWPALLKQVTQDSLPLAGTQGFAFSHGRAAVPEQFPQWNKHKQAAFHCWLHTASLPTPAAYVRRRSGDGTQHPHPKVCLFAPCRTATPPEVTMAQDPDLLLIQTGVLCIYMTTNS